LEDLENHQRIHKKYWSKCLDLQKNNYLVTLFLYPLWDHLKSYLSLPGTGERIDLVDAVSLLGEAGKEARLLMETVEEPELCAPTGTPAPNR
jgi:hypothetical protein